MPLPTLIVSVDVADPVTVMVLFRLPTVTLSLPVPSEIVFDPFFNVTVSLPLPRVILLEPLPPLIWSLPLPPTTVTLPLPNVVVPLLLPSTTVPLLLPMLLLEATVIVTAAAAVSPY